MDVSDQSPATRSSGRGTAERKTPVQDRSRARLGKILASAERLIARHGSDRLRMGELATESGISIGSLYQYFPDKPSVIQTLAGRYNAESRRCIVEALSAVREGDELAEAFTGLMTQFYGMVRSNPVMRDIWAGMQADKQLAALQLAESRAMGQALADAVARVRAVSDAAELTATMLLVWDLGESTVRLAIHEDEPAGQMMVAAYVRMALTELTRET